VVGGVSLALAAALAGGAVWFWRFRHHPQVKDE
jgi:hypothetical protein